MTREAMHALIEHVKANVAALDACPGPHDFVDITPGKIIGKRYRCSTCLGEIDGVALVWYQRGLVHGRHPA